MSTGSTTHDISGHGRPATGRFEEPKNKPSLNDLIQNLTPQLLAFFQVNGYEPAAAKVLVDELSSELTARVRDILWWPGIQAGLKLGVITAGDLKLDLACRLLWRGGRGIHLSPKEFDLLALMMKNPDVPITHVRLLRSVWGVEYGGEVEYLRTYVHTLRKKIEKYPSNPEYILSEPWIGYRFRMPKGPARSV